MKIWNVEAGHEVKTLTGHTNNVNSIAFSSDSQYIASGSSDYTVKIWKVEDESEVRILAEHSNSVESVAFSKDS